jgi:prepilin-type N-terminal cleavage/methylation domain-containing protein
MRKKGFTLIELLVVIAIIGILAATVVMGLRSARGKANDTQRKTNVRSVMSAMEQYYDDNSQHYPLQAAGTASATLSATAAYTAVTSYMNVTGWKNDDRPAAYSGGAIASNSALVSGTTATAAVVAATSPVFLGQNMESGAGAGTVFVVQSAN